MTWYVLTDCANLGIKFTPQRLTVKPEHSDVFKSQEELKRYLMHRWLYFPEKATSEIIYGTNINLENIQKWEDQIINLFSNLRPNELYNSGFRNNHDCCDICVYKTDNPKFELTFNDLKVLFPKN